MKSILDIRKEILKSFQEEPDGKKENTVADFLSLLGFGNTKGDLFSISLAKRLKNLIEFTKDPYKQYIFEFVQNAEDSGSSSLLFMSKVFDDQLYLVVINNGRKFDWKDIKGISAFMHSDKQEKQEFQIGRFGIGFKLIYKFMEIIENKKDPEIDANKGIVIISWDNYEIKQILKGNKSKELFVEDPKEGSDLIVFKLAYVGFPIGVDEEVFIYKDKKLTEKLFPYEKFQKIKDFLKSINELKNWEKGSIFLVPIAEEVLPQIEPKKPAKDAFIFLDNISKVKYGDITLYERASKEDGNKFLPFYYEDLEKIDEFKSFVKKGGLMYRDYINIFERIRNSSKPQPIISIKYGESIETNLFAFLPATETKYKLKFSINAPFRIDTSREKVVEERPNKELIEIALISLKRYIENLINDIENEEQDAKSSEKFSEYIGIYKCMILSFDKINEPDDELIFDKEIEFFIKSRLLSHFLELFEKYMPGSDKKLHNKDSILLKKTKVNKEPQDFGLKDQYWFYFEDRDFNQDDPSEDLSTLYKIVGGNSPFKITKYYSMVDLISEGEPEIINNWLTNEYSEIILNECNSIKNIQKLQNRPNFIPKFKKLKIIEMLDGSRVSFETFTQKEFLLTQETIALTEELKSLGFNISKKPFDQLTNLYNEFLTKKGFEPNLIYIKSKDYKKVIDNAVISQESSNLSLSAIQKWKIIEFLIQQNNNNNLTDLHLFKNTRGIIQPLANLLGISSINKIELKKCILIYLIKKFLLLNNLEYSNSLDQIINSLLGSFDEIFNLDQIQISLNRFLEEKYKSKIRKSVSSAIRGEGKRLKYWDHEEIEKILKEIEGISEFFYPLIVPEWILPFQIDMKEYDIRLQRFLCSKTNIFRSIILPNWSEIFTDELANLLSSKEMKQELYQRLTEIKKLDINQCNLDDKAFILSKKHFVKKNEIYYHEKLKNIEPKKFVLLSEIFPKIFSLKIPDLEILEYLNKNPFNLTDQTLQSLKIESEVTLSLNEIITILDYYERENVRFFDKYIINAHEKDQYQISEKNESLYCIIDNSELIEFIKKYFNYSFITIPNEIKDEFKVESLKKNGLCTSDEVIEKIVEVLKENEDNFNIIAKFISSSNKTIKKAYLNKISKLIIEDNPKTLEFIEQVLKLLISLEDKDFIATFIPKIFVKINEIEYNVKERLKSDSILFEKGKYRLSYSKLFNNRIISEIRELFKKLMTQMKWNDEQVKLFFGFNESDEISHNLIYEEIKNNYQKGKMVENRTDELCFILLYMKESGVDVKSIDFDYKINALNNQEYPLKIGVIYTQKLSFIDDSYILNPKIYDIEYIEKLFDLKINSYFQSVDSGMIILSIKPFVLEKSHNFYYFCEGYKEFKENLEIVYSFLESAFENWNDKKKPIAFHYCNDFNCQDIIQDIFGFNFNAYISNSKFSLTNENFETQENPIIKEINIWSNSKNPTIRNEKMNFLKVMGLNIDQDSPIIQLRMLFLNEFNNVNNYNIGIDFLIGTLKWIKEMNLRLEKSHSMALKNIFEQIGKIKPDLKEINFPIVIYNSEDPNIKIENPTDYKTIHLITDEHLKIINEYKQQFSEFIKNHTDMLFIYYDFYPETFQKILSTKYSECSIEENQPNIELLIERSSELRHVLYEEWKSAFQKDQGYQFTIHLYPGKMPKKIMFCDNEIVQYEKWDSYLDSENHRLFVNELEYNQDIFYIKNILSKSKETNKQLGVFDLDRKTIITKYSMEEFEEHITSMINDSENEDIGDELIKNCRDRLIESSKTQLYTFRWLMDVINYELFSVAKNRIKEEITVVFQEIFLMGNDKLLLRSPNRYFSKANENIDEVPLIIFKGRERYFLLIDVSNVKDEHEVSVRVLDPSKLDKKIKEIEEKDDSFKDKEFITIDTLSEKIKPETESGYNKLEGYQAKIVITDPFFLYTSLKDEILKQIKDLGCEENEVIQDKLCENLKPNHLEFIFGPPGTGKTTNLALRILNTLAIAHENNQDIRILLVTPTNKASDVIIENILKFIHYDHENGTKLDSIVKPDTIGFDRKKIQSYIEFLRENQNYKRIILRFGKTDSDYLRDLVYRQKDDVLYDRTNNEIEFTDVKLGEIKTKTYILATTIVRVPYEKFNCATDVEHLRKISWDYFIIDEASMIAIPHIVYSILNYSEKISVLPEMEDNDKQYILKSRITIAGDPFQILPVGETPTYNDKSNSSLIKGWNTENIYKLVKLDKFNIEKTPIGNFSIYILKEQFRSVNPIGELFSEYKYNPKLIHGRKIEREEYLDYESHKFSPINIIKFPVLSFRSEGFEVTNPKLYFIYKMGYSSYHIYSALLAVELVMKIRESYKDKEKQELPSIGIVAPYRIQSLFAAVLIEKYYLKNKIEFEKRNITCGTVHSFQGDARDIIILVLNPPNLPRNMKRNSFAHINDPNIINVGISRARDYLFLLIPDDEGVNDLEIGKIEKLTKLEAIDKNTSRFNHKDIEKLLFEKEMKLLAKKLQRTCDSALADMTEIFYHQEINAYDSNSIKNQGHKYEIRVNPQQFNQFGAAIDVVTDLDFLHEETSKKKSKKTSEK